jgi:hypothetical protein
MRTGVPFGPRSFRTASSLVHPFVLFAFNLRDDVAAPQTLLIRWRAFKQRTTLISPSTTAIVMPRP